MDGVEEVPREEWARLKVPDAYYTYDYCALAAIPENDVDRISLLKYTTAEGTVYMPILVRRIPGVPYFDATSPYGYSGPWVEGTANSNVFFTKYNEWAQTHSIVTTFIRFHPLLENAVGVSGKVVPLEIGPTAQWNTGKGRDLLGGMSKGHRKALRRAIRLGVTSRVRRSSEALLEFRTIYEQSMRRVNANAYYLFPDKYWEHLSNLTEPEPLQFDACYEGKTVASVLALRFGQYLHVHLSGTTDVGRTLGAAMVCRYAAAQWAQQNHVSWIHSGGGVGGTSSSLLDWKRKFDVESPLATFMVAEAVHDLDVYRTLSAGCTKVSYFPPWRAPN